MTAILAFVPAWARDPNCVQHWDLDFCAVDPTKAADFGRFAGAIASRYNGLSGNGRVVNFVIHNEVNHNTWYDIGCYDSPSYTPCNANNWVSNYAASYIAAYDRIKAEQSAAKVLVPFTGHFAGPDLAESLPIQSFLTKFAPLVGLRQWMVAFHAPSGYTNNVDDATYPHVYLGQVGKLVGWLNKTFPGTPSAWEVQLTENGIQTQNTPGGPATQAATLCTAFRDLLGTPGVTSYVYTPLSTWPTYDTQELISCTGGTPWCPDPTTVTFKPSWSTWALSNIAGTYACGFDDLPYTRLSRYYNPSRGHWVSTRQPPPGFGYEGSWKLLRDPQAGTHPLFECHAPGFGGTSHGYVTTQRDCAGLEALGTLGYAYDAPAAGRVPLYRCYSSAGTATHLVSSNPSCEGLTNEGIIGYAVP